ncbi:MAG TPA: LptF/LptG family permease [Candidatus Limnocylindrales bacterium]|nr:LptF/LptG family permease [Candidatus Limnocylindrales bacterium]
MRIFTRYILKEVLSHGLIGASVFTFVIFMREVGRLLELVVRNSAPVPSVAEIFFLIMPAALTVTIPMGVLVGILIGLSRMASDSEVTAMRASGVSVRTFLKIGVMFGVAAWLLALANTAVLAPRSATALARLQKSLASSQISFEVQPRVFYEDFKNYVLYVEDVTTTSGAAVWKNVFLADITTPGAPKITIAKQAIVSNGGPNTIRLHLISGEIHENNARSPDQYTIQTFSETDTALTMPPVAKPVQEAVPVSQMTTLELLHERRNPSPEKARLYWTEFNRRFSLPTACLVLVLIGVPLGLSAKKGGKGAGFVLTIVLVFIYYFLYGAGLSLARNGKVPVVVGVWMGNVIFALVGTLLLWRTDKLPVEIGLGEFLMTSFKSWTASLRKGRERERVNGSRRGRFFSTRFPLILDDYVLRNFVSHLLLIIASFLVLTIIFTFFELLSDIVHNKIPLTTVGEYLLNQVPALLYLVTPLSVLLGVLVTFGLMQKSNEITAMKATGISIYRTIIPILVIATALAGGLFLLDQWYLPYANKRVETLKNLIKGKPAQTYARPDRKWIFGQTSRKRGQQEKLKIYYYEFYEPDRNVFGNISSFELDPQTFQIAQRIYAARAHWSDSLQQWVFERGWKRSFNGDTVTDFHRFDVDTFAELNEPPSYFKKEVRQSQEMSYDELASYIRDMQQSGFDVVRLRVALQKKIAFPLITLVMAVLAFPFALSAGRRGALTGVATALIIALVYWVTSGLFEAMGNVSQLPPLIAAWAPDVIFGLAGGYLILKTPS